MTPRGPARVLVVGAGPAGLWAAWRAAAAGHHVTVVERAEHVGGMAASLEVGGLRVDLGSHRLHPSTPAPLLARLRGLLGEDLQVRPRNGRLRLGDRWLGFPLRTGDLLASTPPRFALGAARDALTGPLRRPRADTFAEVVRAGLGPTVADGFYAPYVAKIWGVDPGELAGDLARRRVSASSPADIARRLVRGATPEGRTFLYPRRGFGQIADAIADAAVDAGVDLRLGCELVDLDPGDAARTATATLGDGTAVDADLVWSTAPLPALAACTRGVPADALEAAGRLEHRGLVLVYLVLEGGPWTPFDAHYLPGPDQLAARLSEPRNYRTSADDPTDRTVLCAEVPASVGDVTWNATDDALAARLVDDLARLGLPAARPVEVRTVRLPRVYPILRPGTAWDLAALTWWLADQPRLVSFGRQGSFVPDNTHHALLMGEAAAGALGVDGAWDAQAWAAAVDGFRSHVVED